MNRTALIFLVAMAFVAMACAVPSAEEKAPSMFPVHALETLSRNVLEELSRTRRRTSSSTDSDTEDSDETTEVSVETCSLAAIGGTFLLGLGSVLECVETALDDIVGGSGDSALASDIIASVTCGFTAIANTLLDFSALDCVVSF